MMTHLIAPFGIRMPSELKEWLVKQANGNRRSLNSELVKRLEESRVADEKKQGGGDDQVAHG